MKTVLLALAAATSIGVAMPANAANVIDQQDTATTAANMASFGQSNLAQSFQTAAGNVSGAGIYLAAYGSGVANITIGLWDALPNQAGATRLASATGSTSINDQWFDVFWSPASVTSGKKYYLTFSSDNTNYGIKGDLYNQYAGGNVFANSGYQSFVNYDYTFRTYTDNAVNGAVPEPATWAMMLVGVGMMGFAMRRSRKSKVNTTVSFA